MTWVVPPERAVVPSLAGWACPAALGAPLVSSGGQLTAHAPAHVEVVPVSFPNR